LAALPAVRTAEAISAELIKADLCVLGAGSAGLSVAAGAVKLGARTVLVEIDRMGGDCLNTGCVPSKSLLAAAKSAHAVRNARRYGINTGDPRVDFVAVHNYVHEVIGTIAPHDSVERFTALGCTVIKARAQFIDHHTIEADGKVVRPRRFVIATGSRPAVPPISGLDELPFFTTETLFDNTVLPEHLLVIGAGPIGCEMAQAHRRLGSAVTVLDIGQMLPNDDADAVAVIRRSLAAEGVRLLENVNPVRVEKRAQRIVVFLDGGDVSVIEGSHLFIATGRRPNVENLGLEAGGIRFNHNGIEVDSRLRTSNWRVYAAGDVIGSYQYTHLANYHASIVLQNALFRLRTRSDLRALPWVTYTDPELAQVGMSEAQARRLHADDIRIVRSEFTDNDRAQIESATEGFVKVVASRTGRVLGVTIVGRAAGELAFLWVLAISKGISLKVLASAIVPYPTFSEISKHAAGSFYAPRLFGRYARNLVRFLRWLG
jgi:pyruvate/2-oxoglutarate dehydrogenase complex dihydrolipoamide dehydrogenase (E3) component